MNRTGGLFGEDVQPLTGDPMRFAGKELDEETGQQYFDARYYRNTWGRFTTVDPIAVSAAMADPQQWNRYAYARNNPLKWVDPRGMQAIEYGNQRKPEPPTFFGGIGCPSQGLGTSACPWPGLPPFSMNRPGNMTTPRRPDPRTWLRPPGSPQGPDEGQDPGGDDTPCPSCDTQGPVGPNVPPQTPSHFVKALREGVDDAKERLWTIQTCGNLFGGAESASAVIDETTYRFIELPENPGASAGKLDSRHIAIVPTGAFMTGIRRGFMNVDWDLRQSRSLIILHELGHQVDRFGPDEVTSVNHAHTRMVVNSCGY